MAYCRRNTLVLQGLPKLKCNFVLAKLHFMLYTFDIITPGNRPGGKEETI